MQENNSIIIAMLEELLTISKSQRTEQTVTTNVDLTPIKELIENSNRENKEYYDAKSNRFTGAIVNELSKINKRMDGIKQQEQPDFEDVKQQLAEAIDKMDEMKVKHNINEKRHSFVLYTKESWILLAMFIAVVAGSISTIYHLSRPNVQRDDDALKYRYIKMKGDASAEQIATLEEIFELNRNNETISQMREDVEIYEEAVRKQTALAEQARLKELAAKEQESKAKPEEQPVPFANEEQHYKHVNSALAQYTTEYVEAADTSSINRTDLDKTSLEANKFLRTIKQITTDSELKSQCDVLIGYINEGIYAQLPRYLKALSREYKNDRAKMKQDEYSLQNKISELLGEYQTMNKEQRHDAQDISNPQIIISESFK